MPSIIKKIKLFNYRRFKEYIVIPNERISIFAGDNEVGKSSILESIDLVAGGNVRRVEAIGIDKLLNNESVKEFLTGRKEFEKLPKLIMELYLDGEFDHTMNGRNHSDGNDQDGIRLICEPNPDYQPEIIDSMRAHEGYFPYDYYSIRFSTFADVAYTGYKKKLRSIFIDSTNMSSDYATNEFVKRMYSRYTEDDIKERAVHKSKYRQLRDGFQMDSLQDINERIPADSKYAFGLKPSSAVGFENDLMIFEDEISIDNKGTGRQVFIKTDFTLERSGLNVDVVLIEEPENHLSHVNLRKLVETIADAQSGQIFIATHNSFISTRLELRNLLIMHKEAIDRPVSLSDLSVDTAKYFIKAPVASILEFVIANKAILVEGPSEYMLFEKFYETVALNKPEVDGVQVVDIRGLSFKRYLDVAKFTSSKVAIITDNDGDKQKHCIDKYSNYSCEENIEIFFEEDDDESKSTFEKVLYCDNSDLCDSLFEDDALSFMLSNKTEAAYSLLNQDKQIVVPEYIRKAIVWIRK
jgi:predicted ATP-dependent endonuclease of OLD family